jgi:hypothetical protein
MTQYIPPVWLRSMILHLWIAQTYDSSQIRQGDLHKVQTLLVRAKVFRHIIQDCTLSLIYFF